MAWHAETRLYLPRSVTVHCDACQGEIRSDSYYCKQCSGDNNFVDFCMLCVRDRNCCTTDSHRWIKHALVHDGSLSRMVPVHFDGISPSKAFAMYNTYPTLFAPPNPQDTPQSLFSDKHRFIRKTDPREILIYTDGSCLGNGQSNPRAGWCFVYRPSVFTESGSLAHAGTISQRLETRGPTGQVYKQTSNRAELRAVIAALQFIDWSTDCNGSWRRLVIATDSEYVAISATKRIQIWETKGWKTLDRAGGQNQDVKNQDLWKLLLILIRTLQGEGVKVSFWRIPRAWNKRADKFAKESAENYEVAHFTRSQYDGPTSAICTPFSC